MHAGFGFWIRIMSAGGHVRGLLSGGRLIFSDLLIARHPCVLIPSFVASALRRRHSAGVQKYVRKRRDFRHLTPWSIFATLIWLEIENYPKTRGTSFSVTRKNGFIVKNVSAQKWKRCPMRSSFMSLRLVPKRSISKKTSRQRAVTKYFSTHAQSLKSWCCYVNKKFSARRREDRFDISNS